MFTIKNGNFACPFFINPIQMAEKDQLGVYLTEAIATYMQAKFRQMLHGSDVHTPFPADWDLTLLQECNQAVAILIEAYHNPCVSHSYFFWCIYLE